ncbi:hypothetical protein ACP6PL_14535 [Dapis sp. BLCC M126]|uniref:hypothetical protein n=1 Tax=Dapis sp. BLCC M126 TaxID=3400189 RepID=UPI003CF90757
MIISNLNHLEDLSNKNDDLKGGSITDAFLYTYGQAMGDLALVKSKTELLTFSYSGPYGGSVSFNGAVGFVGAIAIDWPEMPNLPTY